MFKPAQVKAWLGTAAYLQAIGGKVIRIEGRGFDVDFVVQLPWYSRLISKFGLGLVNYKRYLNCRTTLKRRNRREHGLPEKYGHYNKVKGPTLGDMAIIKPEQKKNV